MSKFHPTSITTRGEFGKITIVNFSNHEKFIIKHNSDSLNQNIKSILNKGSTVVCSDSTLIYISDMK